MLHAGRERGGQGEGEGGACIDRDENRGRLVSGGERVLAVQTERLGSDASDVRLTFDEVVALCENLFLDEDHEPPENDAGDLAGETGMAGEEEGEGTFLTGLELHEMGEGGGGRAFVRKYESTPRVAPLDEFWQWMQASEFGW